MIFKELNISNFRSVRDFHTTGFERINLFFGNNNCGKTTILEALFLLCGFSNPILLHRINILREYRSFNFDDLDLFFYKRHFENQIKIEGVLSDGINRTVSISPHKSEVQEIISFGEEAESIFMAENQEKEYDSLQFNFQTDVAGASVEGKSSIVLLGNDKVTVKEQEPSVERRIGVKRDENYKEELKAAFITPRSNERSYIKNLNELLKDKKKPYIIDALQKLDPSIVDIMTEEDDLLCDVGFDKFLPIHMMGDGVRKFMHIITALYAVKGGVLFVDEIDNGLHHSSTCILWKLIYEIATELDVQVFATTHSIDTLLSLKTIMEQNDSQPSQIACIKLKQLNDGKLKAYIYDRDSFTHLLNQEIEIR